MECKECLKRWHEKGLKQPPIIRPEDILMDPTRHVIKLYHDVRFPLDRYMTSIMEEVSNHDKLSKLELSRIKVYKTDNNGMF